MRSDPPVQSAPHSNELRSISQGQSFNQEFLVSTLNKLCFYRLPITFIFKRPDDGQTVTREAIPRPCMDNQLISTWTENDSCLDTEDAYTLNSLHIKVDDKLMVVHPKVLSVDREGIRVTLPEDGLQFNTRKVIHYPCNGASIRIDYDGKRMSGELLDFHAGAFSMALKTKHSKDLASLNRHSVWNATLHARKDMIFAGPCKIVRKDIHQERPIVVLSPVQNNIPIQKPKKYRCARVKPVPAPHINFKHRLTGKLVILDAHEISGSGLSVIEDGHNSVMMPGMRIPTLELRLSNLYRIKCRATVVHRSLLDDQDAQSGAYLCGIVFTDMDMRDHTKLVAYVQQAKDQHTLVCNSPDMDELWDFFFDTGFLYPQKFHHIHSQQAMVKKTLEKLYLEHPVTSRHFIIQDKGVIKGLIALQRVYKFTWMMHHLAARKDAVIAGPKVLSLIGSFINDSYHLEANRMKYAILYFRPENRFPSLVFGGVAKSVKDPQICSLDTFAYFQIAPATGKRFELKSPWDLTKTTPADLEVLEEFYNEISGGLMLRAFDLLPGMAEDDELTLAYQEENLKRKRFLYTLKRADTPVAIIMGQITDIGINLSDLTNCMHLFLLRAEEAEQEPVEASLSHLAQYYKQDKAVVNLFPEACSKDLTFDYKKRYTLWTYEMQYSDFYYEHLKKLSRFFKH